MKLIWHGHSCFELITSDGSVVFDPYSPGSVRGLKLPKLHADAVICSHGHGDHNYAAGVLLTGEQPRFSVRQLKTYHDGKKGALRGDNLCSVIDAEGLSIAHLGDLGHVLTPEQAEWFGHIDLLMIPVGGYYTICANQAKEVAQQIDADIIVPMHYSDEKAKTGLPEVAPVDDFLRLWEPDMTVYLSSNEYDVHPSSERRVVVFAPDRSAVI